MAEFTPGPWEIVNKHYIESADHGIAKVHYGREGEADTYLIAAAPDMYEALLALVDAINDARIDSSAKDINHALTLTRMAIAKAEGKEA